MIDLTSVSEIFAFLNREDGFRLLSMASLGPGFFPESRLVVRRRVDESTRSIHVHTDVRSPKIAQLQTDPRLTLLFYDPATRIQVRCRAVASIHIEDGIAHDAWLSIAPLNRVMYAAVESPGQMVEDHPPMPAIPEEDDLVAFRHFAVIVCYLTEMDVLELTADQNRRALLRWTGSGWESAKLAP
ncbi:PNPOx family protein [Zavarzinella formosa]|uniref:pyridoxamine 5'-phosphate oxidase family protein n=1 Tax=Zavarzinella formosa TaxID=360055 RepID=UPI00030FF702|nr:pyridoxamine 5'-phosphate oxidase family protein [Zavarzinella formosa]